MENLDFRLPEMEPGNLWMHRAAGGHRPLTVTDRCLAQATGLTGDFPERLASPDRLGVLFGCFARKIDGDSWFTWWFHHLPGSSISPKRTPMHLTDSVANGKHVQKTYEVT